MDRAHRQPAPVVSLVGIVTTQALDARDVFHGRGLVGQTPATSDSPVFFNELPVALQHSMACFMRHGPLQFLEQYILPLRGACPAIRMDYKH